ncbi:MAG: hypothetical protein DRN20_03940 [Thermoplasmata archaeon]|nr:MAG: hypothetical protein DRN20_03940 [Thermoplasmata archaeon]
MVVRERVEKAKKEAKEAVTTAAKFGQGIISLITDQLMELREFLDNREIEVKVKFNNLSLNGEVSKTISFLKKETGKK